MEQSLQQWTAIIINIKRKKEQEKERKAWYNDQSFQAEKLRGNKALKRRCRREGTTERRPQAGDTPLGQKTTNWVSGKMNPFKEKGRKPRWPRSGMRDPGAQGGGVIMNESQDSLSLSQSKDIWPKPTGGGGKLSGVLKTPRKGVPIRTLHP